MSALKLVGIALAAILLAGCDDSSNGGGTGSGGSGGGETLNISGSISSLADIVGVYEDFWDEGGGIIDEIYIEIAADGQVWEHDYQGDSYHQGPNCYDIGYWDEIEHRGGNVFYSDASFAEFEARFENNRLVMDFGSYEEVLGPKVNIDPANFRAAECTD